MPARWHRAILQVRSAENGQSHCSQMYVVFSTEPDDYFRQTRRGLTPSGSTWLSFIARGRRGVYATREDCGGVTCIDDGGFPVGPPAEQPYWALEARHNGLRGTGTVELLHDAHLDSRVVKGVADVSFPDGCRLLADFEAVLTSTE